MLFMLAKRTYQLQSIMNTNEMLTGLGLGKLNGIIEPSAPLIKRLK